MTRDDVEGMEEDLRGMIAERLNIRARSFDTAVRRAGRLLPAPARAAAADLAQLKSRLEHPKLAARTDPAIAEGAATTIRAALARHRPGDIAARDRAFLLAEIGFRLLVIIGAGLVVLHWTAAV